jgi:hypothetical protein
MAEESMTIQDIATELKTCRQRTTDTIGDLTLDATIYSADLFALHVLNRSAKLISGYLLLMEKRNYLCAIPLIRLQLDNCLRFHAANLASKPQAVVDAFLQGKPIKQLRDVKGALMTDGHLATELDKHVPGVKKLYNDTSGYIHLSDKHFYSTIIRHGEEAGRIAFGGESDHFKPEEEVKFGIQMLNASDLVLTVIDSWKNFRGTIPKKNSKQ